MPLKILIGAKLRLAPMRIFLEKNPRAKSFSN